jgi:hypothetical protein
MKREKDHCLQITYTQEILGNKLKAIWDDLEN